MAHFQDYLQPHRDCLAASLESPDWRSIVYDEEELARVRESTLTPPPAPSQTTGVSQYLIERNTPAARALLENGRTDTDAVNALSDWEAIFASGEPFPILFLGLVLTMDCSFRPRCLYCNQTYIESKLKLDDWKAVVKEASTPIPPYVYLTGGEALTLGDDVTGDDGIAVYAAQNGCAVNINTNAALITPDVAIKLVRAGVSKLHISLDSADSEVQASLFKSQEMPAKVMQGIYNVQVARELLGVRHPIIHINCVLTRLNMFGFPSLLQLLLGMRAIGNDDDFQFHLVPVGGQSNAAIRPSAVEWQRFYTETWDEAEAVWSNHQAARNVPDGDRKSLTAHVPFASPCHRVDHGMSLDEYCEMSAAGSYWLGALIDRCIVAPSQTFVLPDGSQHWCGGHAIQRPEPIGNILTGSLRDNIRSSLGRLRSLPVDVCRGCAGATCVINRMMLHALTEQVANWRAEIDGGVGGESPQV